MLAFCYVLCNNSPKIKKQTKTQEKLLTSNEVMTIVKLTEILIMNIQHISVNSVSNMTRTEVINALMYYRVKMGSMIEKMEMLKTKDTETLKIYLITGTKACDKKPSITFEALYKMFGASEATLLPRIQTILKARENKERCCLTVLDSSTDYSTRAIMFLLNGTVLTDFDLDLKSLAFISKEHPDNIIFDFSDWESTAKV
jgi:hypothetical protein